MSTASSASLAPRRTAARRHVAVLTVRYGMFIALALWVIIMSFASEYFLTLTNIFNVTRQAAPIIIIGVGMTFVMATAGIDLSVGSIVALVSCLVAAWLTAGLPALLVMPLVVLAGVFLGLLNGAIVTLGIPAFVVTLASLVSYRGLAFVFSDGYATPITDPVFLWLGRGEVLGINAPMAIAILVAIVGWIVLNHTRIGLYTLATGGREEAARVMGLSIGKIKLFVYALTGALAGLGGMVIAARLSNGSPNAGVTLELDVIAAVVLGGTSLFGGSATIAGTVVGALLINFIRNGLNLMNVNPYWVQVVTSLVLVLAVILNTVVNRKVEGWARVSSEEANE